MAPTIVRDDDARLVLEVCSASRQVGEDPNAKGFEHLCWSYSGKLEDLRGMDGTRGKQNLFSCLCCRHGPSGRWQVLNPDRFLALKQDTRNCVLGKDVVVGAGFGPLVVIESGVASRPVQCSFPNFYFPGSGNYLPTSFLHQVSNK